MVRTGGDPTAADSRRASVMHDLDPTVPFEEPRTMTEVVSETLVFERMESWLFGIFAGLALVLALVGLYGLVSHEVEQSTRDIGVRMALGATRARILAMVLQRVAWMLAAGSRGGSCAHCSPARSSAWSSTSTRRRRPAAFCCWPCCWWLRDWWRR